MSHRRAPEPQWVRELAEACLIPARAEQPKALSALVRAAASRHGLDPNQLAVRIAKLWQQQGHVRDWKLKVDA